MRLMGRRALTTIGLLGLAALAVLAFRPAPVPVETARVERGDVRVTIDEEGETRVRDRFVITAPIDGRVARIELHAGDSGGAGDGGGAHESAATRPAPPC